MIDKYLLAFASGSACLYLSNVLSQQSKYLHEKFQNRCSGFAVKVAQTDRQTEFFSKSLWTWDFFNTITKILNII